MLFLLGCKQNATEPTQELTVQTDKVLYAPNETIAILLCNSTRSTAFFGHCAYRLGFYIEKKVNSTWVEKSSVAIVCLAIYPIGVRAVESRMSNGDTIVIGEAGTYRLRFPFGWQLSNTWADSLFSKQFTVQ